MRLHHRHTESSGFVKSRQNHQLISVVAGVPVRTVHVQGGDVSTFIDVTSLSIQSGYDFGPNSMPIVSETIAVPSKPRTAEEWIAQHARNLTHYAGEWIAVESKGVVARSVDFDSVFQQARQKGFLNPLVFKVPQPRNNPKVVSVKKA